MSRKLLFGILTLALLIVSIGIFLKIKFNSKIPELKSISQVELVQLDGTKADFVALANFYNPNNFNGQVLNSEVKVISNGFEIANISQSDHVYIGSLSDFKVPLKFSLKLSELGMSHGLSGFIEKALSDKRKISVHFSGYTRVKNNGVVFKIPIEIDQEIVF